MADDERRQAAETELRVAADSMLDGFGILSPVRDDAGEISDFRYRYVNDAYCAFVGFDRGLLLGHRVGELFPQFLDGERFELYRRVALTGEPFRTDEVQLPSTWAGTALASRVFDTVIASMGEDLVLSVRDITERKRAEAELAHVKTLLERTQQISKTGGWEYDVATGGLTWTDEVYRIYGIERTSDPPDVATTIAAYDQDSAPIIGAAFERLVAEGEPYDLELSLARADGQRIWVRTIGRPVFEGGRVVRVNGAIADITERKQAEQELRLRAELLDLAHDAVIVREPVESRVTFWNREAETIYGYDRAEAVGRVTHELLATVFPESEEAVDVALAQHGRWEGELRHRRKDGTVIAVSSRQALARDEHGQAVAIIALNSDVTDRRRAEQEIRTLNAELEQRVAGRTAELARANKELETFAYSVSHDLRAPLRAVDGFSKALLDDYADQLDEGGRHDLERVRAGAVRMGNLIDEILQLSRLSRRQFERVPVDLSALANEVIGELMSAEPERQVEVEIQDGLRTYVDLALARSVLQNLLSNAYKFTSNNARSAIRFGALEQNGVPVYFVADNGAGFDMAHAAELFRPFHRLHRESEFPGDGIGLATVARAVHRHAGVIWAEGSVNQGATFYFSLIPGAHPPANAATGEDVIPAWRPTTP